MEFRQIGEIPWGLFSPGQFYCLFFSETGVDLVKEHLKIKFVGSLEIKFLWII